MTAPAPPASVPRPDPAETIAAALKDVVAIMSTVIASAEAYRTKCLDAGFSPGAADQMAAQFHEYVIKMAVHGLGTGAKE